MKATGIIREIDELGRIVIPKRIRTSFDLKDEDPVEIYVEDDSIIIKKHQITCVFCGSDKNLTEFMGKKLCADCKAKLKE